MSDQFLAEIRLFPYFGANQAPSGWAVCNGQLLGTSQFSTLYSLLGTNFGGDGRTTFGLPNLPGRIVMSPGQGPGLPGYDIGSIGGSPSVTLDGTQLPAHNHGFQAVTLPGQSNTASQKMIGTGNHGSRLAVDCYVASTPDTPLAANVVSMTGNGQPHNNLMPYVVFNFCIALQGVYPQRP